MSGLQVTCLVVVLVATVVGVGFFARGVARIVGTVRLGRPLPGRWRPVGPRLAVVLREAVGHGKFRHNRHVSFAHWCVMVSFPILLVTVVDAYGQVVDPRWTIPVIGHWQPLEWAIEAIAWLALVGIGYLMVVRQMIRPRAAHDEGRRRASRFFGSSQGQAVFVELTVLLVVLAALGLRGLAYALETQAGSPVASGWHFPLTAWYGSAWAAASTSTLEAAGILLATVKVLVSMAWFVVVGLQPTMGVAWHRFLALVTLYTKRYPGRTASLGPAEPLRGPDGGPVNLLELEEIPEDLTLGVGAVEDLSWKGLLDIATCTECGRCQTACPAWATGKPLSPKLLVLGLRDHAAATAPYLRAARSGGDAHDVHLGVDLVASGVVEPDVLWSCTTCGACVQECPVDIEHVDLILDIRRHQVMAASSFPRELTKAFTGMERAGNPWGAPARTRLDWRKGLPFDVPVVGSDVASLADVDYLFWVGCAGAYDERAMRTTRAVAELLHAAGVSFAVLQGESCTGDPARRAGNEALFQTMAAGNIEALDAAGARRIVVTCAHCLNALAREYPAFGGHYEVVHHTELLNTLLAEGRLTPLPSSDERTVTYHDPCYLGRHNEIYAPPRELLAAAGITVTEMPRNREDAFCCGGGGARAFMEESLGTRIGTERAAEAIATGAGVIATACPYCTVMLRDGVAACGAAAGSSSGNSAASGHAAAPSSSGNASPRPAASGAPGPTSVGVPEVADIAVLLRDRLVPSAAD